MKCRFKFWLLVITILTVAFSCTENASVEKFYSVESHPESPKEYGEITGVKDTVLTFKSGSSLLLSANSLVRKDSKPIEGTIDIIFQEVHSYGELFTAGVPMLFHEEDGAIGQMVSAGMFNLEAKDASGAELELVKGKTIGVNLTCQANFEGFDLFYLKEKQEPKIDQGIFFQITTLQPEGQAKEVKWERIEKVKVVKNQNLKIDEELKEPIKQPVSPVKNQEEKTYFNVNIDTKTYPEFKDFQSLIWTFTSDTVDPKVLREKWTSMDIQDSGLGYYTMILSSKKVQKSIAVIPVLEGEEFDNAMLDFNKNKKVYEEKKLAQLKAKSAQESARAYLSTFTVSKLGWHNIDWVERKLASMEFFKPRFTNSGANINVKNLKLLSYTKGAKSMVSYSQKNLDEFFYIDLFENALLVEDVNGNYFAIGKNDFKKAKLGKDSEALELVIIESTNMTDLVAIENTLNGLM